MLLVRGMKDCLLDGLVDTLKIIPYLLITFIIMELIEHKLSKKNENILKNNKKYGPILGSLLGAVPQCGFSVVGANLYSSNIITIGTLIAIFLSTSDEMLPLMLSEQVNILTIIKIIGFKVIVGIFIGIIVDIIFKNKRKSVNIKELCNDDNCHCEEDGIILSSIKHTLKITLFILIANILINIIIFYVGEDALANILLNKNILTYFLASLVGLIPNCASSVILTEVYLTNLITIGTLLSGLLTGCGLGLLILFKQNKNLKDNLLVLSIIYIVGVIVGMLVDIVI